MKSTITSILLIVIGITSSYALRPNIITNSRIPIADTLTELKPGTYVQDTVLVAYDNDYRSLVQAKNSHIEGMCSRTSGDDERMLLKYNGAKANCWQYNGQSEGPITSNLPSTNYHPDPSKLSEKNTTNRKVENTFKLARARIVPYQNYIEVTSENGENYTLSSSLSLFNANYTDVWVRNGQIVNAVMQRYKLSVVECSALNPHFKTPPDIDISNCST